MYLRLKPLSLFPHSASVRPLSFAPCRHFVLYYHSSQLNTSLKKVIKQVKKEALPILKRRLMRLEFLLIAPSHIPSLAGCRHP